MDATCADEVLLNTTRRKLMDMLIETCTAVSDGDINATRGARRVAKIAWLLREVDRTKRAMSYKRGRERRDELNVEAAGPAGTDL